MFKFITNSNRFLMNRERHPFEPFLPGGAKILMLGSFPPQPKRWSIVFYYPNFGNDMWRIIGLIFFRDKNRFVVSGEKRFDKDKIVGFCRDRGIALYDTACEVIRLKDNASDKFLQVTEATDIEALISRIPQCGAIVTTGQKATDTLTEQFGCPEPPMGGFSEFDMKMADGTPRHLRLYRLPSSSRAYPLALEKKAEAYRKMFIDMGILPQASE